jgi:hypothetical protein
VAVEFFVTAASCYQSGQLPGYVSASPLNKGYLSGIDDTDAWAHGASYYGSAVWRIACTPNAVGTQHGTINQVRLYSRFFTSQAGPPQWYDDGFPWPAPHYAPFVRIAGTSTYYTPESYASIFRGVKVLGNYNANNPGAWGPTTVAWDITSLATWTDAVINAMTYGVSGDGEVLAYNRNAGYCEATYGTMTAPNHRISQLVLRVNADDPPPAAALINQGMVGE